jgi:peptidoglycan-associated lipoprotein
MKTTTIRSALTIMLSTLLLTACSSQNIKDTAGSDNDSNKPIISSNSGTTNGTLGSDGTSKVITSEQDGTNFNYLPGANNDPNNTQDISLAGLSDSSNLLSQRVIYFDYDKAAIRPEYMILINTHAKLLAKYPNLKMRLEGHADERGSREYNVALSEARSQSVKNIMVAQGPSDNQIRTIGFGEEIPIVRGHNTKSWQKNRRVEIKYDDY